MPASLGFAKRRAIRYAIIALIPEEMIIKPNLIFEGKHQALKVMEKYPRAKNTLSAVFPLAKLTVHQKGKERLLGGF